MKEVTLSEDDARRYNHMYTYGKKGKNKIKCLKSQKPYSNHPKWSIKHEMLSNRSIANICFKGRVSKFDSTRKS